MKLSKIASIVLGGSLIIAATGCGWWDDDDNGGGKASVKASDAYVIEIPGRIINVECNGITKEINVTKIGKKGSLEFNESINDCTIKIPTAAYVDVNLNGIYDKNDTFMSMPLKTIVGEAGFANPITTYAVDKNDSELLKIAADFDPVEAYVKAAKDENIKKLLKVAETIKTVAKVKGYDSVKELNITKDVLDKNVTTDVVLGDLATDTDIKQAVDAKVNAVISLVETLSQSGLSADEIQKVAVQVSDTDKKVSDVIKDLNVTVSKDVLTQLDAIDDNITKANEKLPAKIAVPGYINIGNKHVVVVEGKFATSLEVNNSVNVTDFYHIKIPVLGITQKTVKETKPIKVQINATIKDDKNRSVSFVIDGVEAYQENGNTVTKIPADTKIAMSTNIASLKEAIGGESVDTYVASNMINSDFDVNVQTLINNVTANQDKINKALNKFNDYLKITNTYTVTVEINGTNDPKWIMDLPENNEGNYEISGTVKVLNTEITPPQPGDLNGSSSSSQASSEASSASSQASSQASSASSQATNEFIDKYPDYTIQAKNNTGNPVETVIDGYIVKVYANAEPKTENSNSTIAIFGTINGKNTGAALKLNDQYEVGTKFVVKVYDQDGNLVGESNEIELTEGATYLNFGEINLN